MGLVEEFSTLLKGSIDDRKKRSPEAWKLIKKRTRLYYVFLTTLIAVALASVLIYFEVGFFTVENYKKISAIGRIGSAIGESAPILAQLGGYFWGLLEKAAHFVTPVAAKGLVEMFFQELPEFSVFVALVGGALFWRHKVLVAKIRHQGLDTWRQAFHAPRPAGNAASAPDPSKESRSRA